MFEFFSSSKKRKLTEYTIDDPDILYVHETLASAVRARAQKLVVGRLDSNYLQTPFESANIRKFLFTQQDREELDRIQKQTLSGTASRAEVAWFNSMRHIETNTKEKLTIPVWHEHSGVYQGMYPFTETEALTFFQCLREWNGNHVNVKSRFEYSTEPDSRIPLDEICKFRGGDNLVSCNVSGFVYSYRGLQTTGCTLTLGLNQCWWIQLDYLDKRHRL